MGDPTIPRKEFSPWLPLQLRLEGRLAVLVGAGIVAQRKAEKLSEAGARLRIIAPVFPPFWDGWEIERIMRPYTGSLDLAGAFLVALWVALVVWTYRDMRSRHHDRLVPILAAAIRSKTVLVTGDRTFAGKARKFLEVMNARMVLDEI